MEEIWKDVEGFEAIYQVSNLGRVKSLKRKTNNQNCKEDKILSPGKDNYGYHIVLLCKKEDNGKRKIHIKKVHRLVAMAFIENRESKPLVNHMDWNRINNTSNNLEWTTPKENLNHRKPKNG